ncbi:uncharacterized protein G2W53_033866 [Senna tora]|uniref:Uncharacterized protein n=1 Tax=Senna tora TaxID=362788 RepID=A0A834SZC2_9FABA|nr:uncharacterized protein G2W53_033866 [Senna tora]
MRGSPEQNGVPERQNHILMDMMWLKVLILNLLKHLNLASVSIPLPSSTETLSVPLAREEIVTLLVQDEDPMILVTKVPQVHEPTPEIPQVHEPAPEILLRRSQRERRLEID